MGKAPADQFYWNDWLGDVELQAASACTKGVWINALSRMWNSKIRGELQGTRESLSKICICTVDEFNVFWEEAQALGFCYTSHGSNGNITLRNRRMFKKEKEKESNRIRQKRFYDKKKPNGKPNKDLTSLSSSSTSSSKNNSNLTVICPHEKIKDLWNEKMCPLGLPKVRAWGKDRKSHLSARWKEDPKRQDIEWWEKLFDYIPKCPFLMGKVDPGPGHKRFFIDLPWLVASEEKLSRVIEGYYEN